MGQVEEGRPRLSWRRKAVLSGKCLLPIPGGLTLEAGRGRQRRWTVPKLSVLITLQKLSGRQDQRPCLLSVVMMLGIVCKSVGEITLS